MENKRTHLQNWPEKSEQVEVKRDEALAELKSYQQSSKKKKKKKTYGAEFAYRKREFGEEKEIEMRRRRRMVEITRERERVTMIVTICS